MVSFDQKSFASKVPKVSPSAFVIEADGIMKLTVNIAVEILAENEGGNMEIAREMFLSIEAKAKLFIDEKIPGEPVVHLQKAGLVSKNVKILKAGKEVKKEQSLFTNLFNAQLDNQSKGRGKISKELESILNGIHPECLGLSLGDVSIEYGKGFLFVGTSATSVRIERQHVCVKHLDNAKKFLYEEYGELLDYIPGFKKD